MLPVPVSPFLWLVFFALGYVSNCCKSQSRKNGQTAYRAAAVFVAAVAAARAVAVSVTAASIVAKKAHNKHLGGFEICYILCAVRRRGVKEFAFVGKPRRRI